MKHQAEEPQNHLDSISFVDKEISFQSPKSQIYIR